MGERNGYGRKPAGARMRFCQFLPLDPRTLEQYAHWHRSENIWPEIPAGIRRAGILDMEIYLCGDMGVMILETPCDFDWDSSFGALATMERQAEWEAFVASFQQADAGARSDEKWQPAERIFSLEEALQIAVPLK